MRKVHRFRGVLADLGQGWWFSATSRGWLLPSLSTRPFRLRAVPDRIDGDAFRAYPVEDDVGSATDDQFPDSRFGSGPADERMIP